ncbi:hypothetical protein OF117_00820 [Geodermatophilus sp. YIM 151500]|uniref:hypothetical protein n=1 Tax=Geodermatophilus sp. YIM 151500 TaxID=2984531 RepID=UPI0021E45198|nr:hypothetical protein [Geodermatophilus sp. YIM 151500]MCV2487889.1 hypothetical protein [Geodermatophilus sp. YIM 151500]
MTDPMTDAADGPATSSVRSRGAAWVARHPLAAFVLLAYGISWTLWAPAVLGVGGSAGVLLTAAAVLVALTRGRLGHHPRSWETAAGAGRPGGTVTAGATTRTGDPRR